jgi:hypothetical protein
MLSSVKLRGSSGRADHARSHPLSHDTFGKLIDDGYEAFLWCRSCRSIGDVDIPRLAEHVGRDWMFVGRRWPVHCAACGSEDIETRLSAA